ncbi:M24 family metallopeptidase [Mesorhizobium sp. KR1-2]|uniref:M24 family metallopeptidase n=1 Tax=Mesorhizobium sp. KR1-2 TaxID=3156609 RepID=UPI0032B5E582
MLSMEPSIKRGLTFWDRALLPWDEFHERIGTIRTAMRAAGLEALVVSGNMYEDAALLYLVGGNVDGTMVLTLEGEPSIFTVSGSRESFFLRELTWMQDVSYRGALVGEAVRKALHERGVTGGRVGTAGLQVLAARPYHDLIEALARYELHDFNAKLADIRRRMRPRERTAMARARSITAKAVAAAERVFAEGASNAAAVIEAERVARLEGAWDYRALANIGADELRPLEQPSDERREPLLLWVATRYQGYWADQAAGLSSAEGDNSRKAVAAMTAVAQPGVTAGAVAEAGLDALPEEARRCALAYGLGRGIGIELNGWPVIAHSSDDVLTEGTLLSFHVFAGGPGRPSLASALVEVRAGGAVPFG